jgi:hypothetical protein
VAAPTAPTKGTAMPTADELISPASIRDLARVQRATGRVQLGASGPFGDTPRAAEMWWPCRPYGDRSS